MPKVYNPSVRRYRVSADKYPPPSPRNDDQWSDNRLQPMTDLHLTYDRFFETRPGSPEAREQLDKIDAILLSIF